MKSILQSTTILMTGALAGSGIYLAGKYLYQKIKDDNLRNKYFTYNSITEDKNENREMSPFMNPGIFMGVTFTSLFLLHKADFIPLNQ
jgi:hypothetical protein